MRIHIIVQDFKDDDYLEAISTHSFFLGRLNGDEKFKGGDNRFDGDLSKVAVVFSGHKYAYFVIRENREYTILKMDSEEFKGEDWIQRIFTFNRPQRVK